MTRWTFVGKIMSLLFNMLARLFITFLPRRKHLLISWLQSPSAVILEPQKIKSVTVSIVSPQRAALGWGRVALVFGAKWLQQSVEVVSDSLRPHGLQHTRLCPSPIPRVWYPTSIESASLSITNSQSLPKPMSIVLVMLFNHLILCCPLLLLPSIFPNIRVFTNESVLHIRWPKYWSFSFSISPSNEHPGLISFRMDWLDLLAVQGTLKSLLQHHSSKASILRCSAFFTVQLSHPYMTTWKTIALTRWTFVSNVMSLRG